MLLSDLLEVLGEGPAGKSGAKQHPCSRCCPDVGLRDIEGAAGGGERLLQPLGKQLPVLPGRLLKVQYHAGIAPTAALPQYGGGEFFRILDQGRFPVTDGQQTALGLQQQTLPQQGGVLADPVGHMGKGSSVLGSLPQLAGRHG